MINDLLARIRSVTNVAAEIAPVAPFRNFSTIIGVPLATANRMRSWAINSGWIATMYFRLLEFRACRFSLPGSIR